MKKCKTCSINKELSMFEPRKLSCKQCRNIKRVQMHDFNKNKDGLLKARFGISLNDYNKMFIDQGGCCSICKIPQSALPKSFAVDHDHITGAIRGLLCDNCNRALGQFKDNVNNLKLAIAYLEKTQENSKVIPINVKSARYRSAS